MKLRLGSLIIAGVVLSAGIASADLDKKQASTLRRAADQIADTEKALEKYGEGKQWGVMTERAQGDFERKINRGRDLLSDLPASDSGVKAELDHLAKVEAALKARVDERTQKANAKAGAEASADALMSGPAYEADLAALREMKDIFSTTNWWKLDFYIWERWTTHQDLEKLRGWGKRWPELRKQFTALRAKYAPAIDVKGGVGNGRLMMKVSDMKTLAGNDAEEDFTAFNASVTAFIKDVPARVEADGKTLNALIDKAGSTNDWSAILNPDGKLQGMRNRLVNIPSVYATLVGPTEAAAVDKLAKAASDSADAATAKYATKLVASNTAPANAYFGADKDKLEAQIKKEWKEKRPTETILGIRFRSSEFERTTQWVVDTNATTATKRDYSTLRATVVVKHGANEAAMWNVSVVKDHMANGKVELGFPWKATPPTPEQRLLLTNWK